jgi:hypothetical protein
MLFFLCPDSESGFFCGQFFLCCGFAVLGVLRILAAIQLKSLSVNHL